MLKDLSHVGTAAANFQITIIIIIIIIHTRKGGYMEGRDDMISSSDVSYKTSATQFRKLSDSSKSLSSVMFIDDQQFEVLE